MSPRAAKPARRPPRRSLAGRIVRGLLLLGVVAMALGLLAFWLAGVVLDPMLPPVQSVAEYRKSAVQTSRVYAADGSLLAEFHLERRTLVGPGDLPRHVRLAAVAAEDGDFYTHEGLDFFGMIRAFIVNVRDGRFSQGASTITQQVARTFYLSADKTLTRKLLEVFLARKLERHLSKDEILELYLNQIYFGHGRYGIAEAASYYLAKEVRALTVADAALLMALVPAPERLNPFTDLTACLTRRDRIINAMLSRGYVARDEARAALAEVPALARARPPPLAHAPWFVDVVRRRVEAGLGRKALLAGGLHIHTSLQPAAQEAVDAAVARLVQAQPDGPEVAVVVMDPHTREVLALAGGRDPARSSFNRAIQARRQAGSTFKTFIYGAGLEAGRLTPETSYDNRRISLRGRAGAWRPANYDGVYDGRPTPLGEALARSINVIAVQALRDVGVARVTDFARRLGVRATMPADLSIALGSPEVTPLELVNAYATLAASGRQGQPVFVRRVEDAEGRVLYGDDPQWSNGTTPAVAHALTAMLREVVASGTGKKAAVPGVEVAGKTGTTNDQVDAWFVGYTPDLAAVVWLGHDRQRSMEGGTGGGLAAPLWAEVVGTMMGSYSPPHGG